MADGAGESVTIGLSYQSMMCKTGIVQLSRILCVCRFHCDHKETKVGTIQISVLISKNRRSNRHRECSRPSKMITECSISYENIAKLNINYATVDNLQNSVVPISDLHNNI